MGLFIAPPGTADEQLDALLRALGPARSVVVVGDLDHLDAELLLDCRRRADEERMPLAVIARRPRWGDVALLERAAWLGEFGVDRAVVVASGATADALTERVAAAHAVVLSP